MTPGKILIKQYREKLLGNLQRICFGGFGWSWLAVIYHSSLGMSTRKALITLVTIKYPLRRVTILDSLSIIFRFIEIIHQKVIIKNWSFKGIFFIQQ